MKAQNIYTKKMTLISLIASMEDNSMIDKLLNFINPSVKETRQAVISKNQKLAIDKGLKQIEEGKVIPHKQAMSELKNRHPKYFK